MVAGSQPHCIPGTWLRSAVVQDHPGHVATAHFGRFRDFGLYSDSLAFYGAHMFYYVWDVPIFCLMGAVGGLMGALWVHLNVKVTALRHRFIPVRCSACPLCKQAYCYSTWVTHRLHIPCNPRLLSAAPHEQWLSAPAVDGPTTLQTHVKVGTEH